MSADPTLAIVTWLWGDKYSSDYVYKLASSVRRHLRQPHRFLLMTERERDIDLDKSLIERHAIKDPILLQEKGCFARLRMFDPTWQAKRRLGGRIVCLDLDCVIVNGLDDLFLRKEDFIILQGVNSNNPCPYNGSLMLLRANTNTHVWYDFSVEAARRLPYHDFPDDQGWLWKKAPNAGAFTDKHGVYAFGKVGWPKGEGLPPNARIVAFPGWRDPAKFSHVPWVKENWK